MNFTVSGADFNQKEVNSASININNNKSTKTGKTHAFEGVVVSNGQKDYAKMDQVTYESLVKQADDVKAQIQQSASVAKNSLKALFKRLSGADAVKIDEDGFNLNDATPDEMVDIVDRIKIELAAHGGKVYSAGAGPTTEQIQKVVGSTGLAEDISQKLQESNLPVSVDNCQEISDAVDKAKNINALSEDTKNYLVANKLSPSIDHIYMAQHTKDNEINMEAHSDLSSQEWDELRPQVENILKKTGLEVNDQNLNNARAFIQQQIPVTSDNLLYKAQLDQLDCNMQNPDQLKELVGKMAQTMSEGKAATETLLTEGCDLYTQVADVLDTLSQADFRHVQEIVESGQTFTIANLKASILSFGGLSDQGISSWQSYVSINAEILARVTETDSDSLNTADQNMNSTEQKDRQTTTDYYIQLQEIRVLMTAQSGYFLAQQGAQLNTTPISQLITDLNAYYNNVYEDVYSNFSENNDNGVNYGSYGNDGENVINENLNNKELQNLVTGQDTTTQITQRLQLSVYQTVSEVKKALGEIKLAPDTTIGAYLKENPERVVTIGDFANTGSNLRRQYEQAGQTYEAVGTEVRKDLGDSMKKAITSSTGEILDQIGLSYTQDNAQAVRILAVNQMEITKQSIDQVKELHSQLKQLVSNMKPETALKMIREGINPMDADIRDVNQYLSEQTSVDENAEKYSKFLYKLDQTGEITQEERSQFIGIYKMMNLFTKDAGATIGALIKQGSDITMKNLCTAYQNRKAAGIDASIDQNTGLSEIQGSVDYYNQIFAETGKKLTPETMKQVNQQQPIMERQVDNFCDAVQETYDVTKEEAYQKSYLDQVRKVADADQTVINELIRNEQPVTVNQITAMEHILETGYFQPLISKDRANQYTDSIDDREKLERMYQEERQGSEDKLTNAIQSDDNQNFKTIDQLRMQNKEIGLIQNLSVRHDYKIPFATEQGIGTIHLTLVQDDADTGRISIQFKEGTMADTAMEVKVNGNQAHIFCQCDGDADQRQQLQSHLEKVAVGLKEQYGMTDVSIQTAATEKVNRAVYDQAADSVATDKLYQIAKTIVTGMIHI